MQEEIYDEEIDIKVSPKASTREVTFTDVLARLWLQKYWLILSVVIGVVIGEIIIQSTPKEYTASLTMMPENNGSKKSSTSAALQALGMGGEITTDDAYNPIVYPDIVHSIPFITGLFDVEVQTSRSDTTYTLSRYVSNYTLYPWWKSSKHDQEKEFKGSGEIIDPFMLTKPENSLYDFLCKRIIIDVDRKTSQITISVTLQDALVAAQLTDTVAARLQEYITDYRTAKARTDLDYAIEINEEAQRQYYEAQQAYAEYMDRNQGLALYSAQTTRDRLDNEMKLAFNMYNQTSERVQTCEAKVQEATPVFAVVQPSSVPLYPSAPKKSMILAACVIIVVFIGIIIICWPLFVSGSFKHRLVTQRQEIMKNRESYRNKIFNWMKFHKKRNAHSSDDDDNDEDNDNNVYLPDQEERSADSYSIE